MVNLCVFIKFSCKDSEKCAEMLLKSGADPDITDENGETALHIACRYGHIKLVRIFLADGSLPSNQSNVLNKYRRN